MLTYNLKNNSSLLYYVGISLAPNSSNESGIAILDNNKNIIFLDKFYSFKDFMFFINNFPHKKYSVFSISIPENITLINLKWKYIAKKYQCLDTNFFKSQDWTQKYTSRGSDLLLNLQNEGLNIFRFDLSLLKYAFNINNNFKDRSPADCKYLQNFLFNFLNITPFSKNLLPASQLEALLGAILSFNIKYNSSNIIKLSTFEKIDVISLKEIL